MRTAGRLALALIVATLAMVVPAAARDPAGPTGATILFRSPPVAEAQSGPSRAGLVIRYSDGRTETRCVDFAEAQISGYELLRRSSLPLAVAQGSEGTAICKINGDGCDPAQCLTCRGGPYWSYFHFVNGEWQYSVVGAAGYQVRTGALEGWTFSNGVRPPAASFAQVCAAQAAPTATFTAVPAGRAGPAPPPIVLVGAATAGAAAPPSPSATPPPATATPVVVPTAAASPTAAAALSPTPTPATASMAPDRPGSPSPTAAPPTPAPTRPPAPSPPASASPPAPQPSPTASMMSAPGATQPAATVAASSAPLASPLPLGEGQDEGVASPPPSIRPLPSPLREGEGTRMGLAAPSSPSLNPQPSTLNPLTPGHLLFGALSLALIGYLAFASPRPK